MAEAHKRLDAVLARVPKYAPVLVMKAQWLTTENKLDEALARAKAAVAADPQSAAAHFALAVVHDRRREVADATKSYNEVLRLNPRAVAAQVELSRLSLTSGDRTEALRYAEGSPPGGALESGRPRCRWRGASSPPEIWRAPKPKSLNCSRERQMPPWCTP